MSLMSFNERGKGGERRREGQREDYGRVRREERGWEDSEREEGREEKREKVRGKKKKEEGIMG